jgi:hypothetical protein
VGNPFLNVDRCWAGDAREVQDDDWEGDVPPDPGSDPKTTSSSLIKEVRQSIGAVFVHSHRTSSVVEVARSVCVLGESAKFCPVRKACESSGGVDLTRPCLGQ